jgi:DNA-binding LytR/AlgR family response regulator
VLNRKELQVASFWQFQIIGWGGFYLLVLVASLPYLKQAGVLRDDTVFVASMFFASCLLRPVCRSLVQRSLRTGPRVQIVLVGDIEWIGAAGDYAELHTSDRSHLLRETMASLEQKLDPKSFLRIHRSRIVRTNCILSLRSIENHEYILKLSDGSEHRSSRTYADRLEAWLASGRG